MLVCNARSLFVYLGPPKFDDDDDSLWCHVALELLNNDLYLVEVSWVQNTPRQSGRINPSLNKYFLNYFMSYSRAILAARSSSTAALTRLVIASSLASASCSLFSNSASSASYFATFLLWEQQNINNTTISLVMRSCASLIIKDLAFQMKCVTSWNLRALMFLFLKQYWNGPIYKQ